MNNLSNEDEEDKEPDIELGTLINSGVPEERSQSSIDQ